MKQLYGRVKLTVCGAILGSSVRGRGNEPVSSLQRRGASSSPARLVQNRALESSISIYSRLIEKTNTKIQRTQVKAWIGGCLTRRWDNRLEILKLYKSNLEFTLSSLKDEYAKLHARKVTVSSHAQHRVDDFIGPRQRPRVGFVDTTEVYVYDNSRTPGYRVTLQAPHISNTHICSVDLSPQMEERRYSGLGQDSGSVSGSVRQTQDAPLRRNSSIIKTPRETSL